MVQAVAGAVAADPAAVGASSTATAAQGISPTGRTTTVHVVANDMPFSPQDISVPAGNRLIIHVTNTDTMVHDLVPDTGATTGGDTDMAGMDHTDSGADSDSAASLLDSTANLPDGFTAHDPTMPGQWLDYTFTATRAGIWLYHCSTMPMSAHIANGMFGTVVIDPPDLDPVAKQYVLIAAELYLGPQDGTIDVDKVDAMAPDALVFNGYVGGYDADPLTATAGQRIRIWVLDAGPNEPLSFHVVGTQFDTVFSEGVYLLRPGNAESGSSQVLSLQPGQGGFVELTPPQAGHYPFVSHIMWGAEHGEHGILAVRAP